MHRIVASITTLDQHLEAVGATPEIYRPDACPHCRLSGLWRHGCYHRKADRSAGAQSCNPVAVLRFLCRQCLRTCSRLPLCIAPRRWYDWAVQQLVLALLLAGCSVHRCARCTCRARRTVRRWRHHQPLQAKLDTLHWANRDSAKRTPVAPEASRGMQTDRRDHE